MPSPRALLGVAPAVVVVVGSFALARHHDRPDNTDAEFAHNYGEMIEFPSVQDEDRLHRVALKQETVEDLLDGRLALAQAIDRFEAWMSVRESGENVRTLVSGRSDRERAINQMMSFVRIRASQEPARFNVVLARIEAEAASFIAEVTRN